MGNSSSTPSSSTTTTTTTTDGEQYDVFLSFRGEDTRDGFTSHLYQALHEKQIKTFRDDQLVRGEEIPEGLLSAIGESKISVIIFSENYTSSKWCLLELAEIMKYREKKKQIVIPVFYKVEPSDVRKSYEAASAKHKNEWRPALTEASKISGIVVPKGRNEAEFVCDIVRDVWNKLYNIWPSCDFKGLVGIDKHIEQVVSLLSPGVSDFRIIGIWGMGGMGKTTIADAVFQIISDQFENKTYFTVSVRAESENGLIRLRNKILSKVLNIENKKSGDRSIPSRIREMLLKNKVLIVFDDVDSIGQLETLAGDLDGVGPGSRIIVTTRDKQVLRNCGVKDHNMYEVKGLNHDEALQLFCKHAFKQNHHTEDFEGLSREMVKIATDVPLAVTVLGSLLYGRSKQYWVDAVDQFQGIMNPTIFDRLKISYNGLDEEEKGLFLDIACFDGVITFDRVVYKVDLTPILLSSRTCFLDHLIDKSLVTVERDFIKMHDLLREMGKKIASENRSRLWKQEDVLRMLEHNDGTDAVQGIILHTHDLKDSNLSFQALRKMYNLRTLIITYGDCQCNGGLDYLPDELRYLHWDWYPLEVLPSSFNPKNLVELDLSNSPIRQLWERGTLVPKLKLLNLNGCANLIGIPDLSNIPSAEIINLKYCSSLIEIHSSRECPKNLHSLNLSCCDNLSSFPSNIHLSEEPSSSTSVVLHSSREGKKFSFSDCISLTKFPDISWNIRSLDLSWSGVEEVPSTIQILSKLESLNMSNCESLKRISKSICKLKSLDRLDLEGCLELESFPDILEGMKLKYLNLSETAIKELPPSIGNLNRLELCPGGSGSFYFNFMNCLELNQKAVSNLLIFFRDSLQKMQGMGTEKIISLFKVSHEVTSQSPPYRGRLLKTPDEEVKGSICLPGSEIPKWFSYKNNGSSINIPGLRNDCGRSSYIMGFAVCLVIVDQDYNIDFNEDYHVCYDIHIETSDGLKEGFSGKQLLESDGLKVDNGFIDHLLLVCFLSSECHELFKKLDALLENCGMSDYEGTSFAFKCYGDRYKVKHCGIKPIYVQTQVMNSIAINQDTGDTSGSDDTEETCEPHPKRICTVANQCS